MMHLENNMQQLKQQQQARDCSKLQLPVVGERQREGGGLIEREGAAYAFDKS